MNAPILYFHNAAAAISYMPAGYIRLAWNPVPLEPHHLMAVYEHVLQAFKRHKTGRLLSNHGQRLPMPLPVQTWLAEQWVPRATAEAAYSHCAIVEADAPVSRLAARAVADHLTGPLKYRYFGTEAAAETWLLTAK